MPRKDKRDAILEALFLGLLFISLQAEEINNDKNKEELETNAFSANQGISVENIQQFPVSHNNSASDKGNKLTENKVDTNGYILYCPCMGRFGNQADQLLGSLAFAKGLNRTLVLPPWIIFPQRRPFHSERIKFSRWFSVKHIKKYHKVMNMEHFMKDLAPTIWPKGKRFGYCYVFRGGKKCGMKEGNPFGPFWDEFGVEFDGYYDHPGMLWNTYHKNVADQWLQRFPPSQHLVLAFQGAPGDYPSKEENQGIQKYIKFSDHIHKTSDKYIIEEMRGDEYVAIHLRNGGDMLSVCEEIKKGDLQKIFCSEQCTGYHNERKLTYEMCAPPKKEIIKKVKKYLKKLKTKRLFIGTDNDSMMNEFKKAFKSMKVSLHRRQAEDDDDGAIIDIAIMSKATYFIGNCVSSFSSFVRRQRNSVGKPVDFFGMD